MEDFDRAYTEHAEPLLRFLVYRTGDQALSEDIVADTFEKAFRARRRFDRRRASEKTWLYGIALNVLRDHGRREAVAERHRREMTAAGHAGHSTEGMDRMEERDLVQRALETLAPEEREAIALRYGADLTNPEIAKLTGEKLTTIEGRVYRALRKLRAALAE